jgi:hypothetical protein
VGEFNGDGFDDVTIAAPQNGNGSNQSGRVYTFFGPLTGTIAAASADFIASGAGEDELGHSVAGGDFNGDGSPDLIAGAPQFDVAHGYAAIFFGSGAAQSQTSLTLTPKGDPIVIPPNGGSFRFRLELTNLSSATRTIDVVVTLTGARPEREIARFSQTLSPGESFVQSFTTRIGRRVRAGTYTVTGTASVSGQIEATDSFTLEKQ